MYILFMNANLVSRNIPFINSNTFVLNTQIKIYLQPPGMMLKPSYSNCSVNQHFLCNYSIYELFKILYCILY